jgi:hypothetical protein
MKQVDHIMELAEEYAKATHYYKPDKSRQLKAALQVAVEKAVSNCEPGDRCLHKDAKIRALEKELATIKTFFQNLVRDTNDKEVVHTNNVRQY